MVAIPLAFNNNQFQLKDHLNCNTLAPCIMMFAEMTEFPESHLHVNLRTKRPKNIIVVLHLSN